MESVGAGCTGLFSGLCPAVTMLGVVFGLLAIRDVKLHARRGLRVAVVAIVLGLIVTPLTTLGLMWWNTTVREPMLHGRGRTESSSGR